MYTDRLYPAIERIRYWAASRTETPAEEQLRYVFVFEQWYPQEKRWRLNYWPVRDCKQITLHEAFAEFAELLKLTGIRVRKISYGDPWEMYKPIVRVTLTDSTATAWPRDQELHVDDLTPRTRTKKQKAEDEQ